MEEKYIGIKVGHDEGFGIAIKGGIMGILNSVNAEAVKIAALEVLGKTSDISYTSINNCNIEMGTGKENKNEGNNSKEAQEPGKISSEESTIPVND